MNKLIRSFKLIRSYKREIEALKLVIAALEIRIMGEEEDTKVISEIDQIEYNIEDIKFKLEAEQNKYDSYLNAYKSLDYKNKEQYQESIEDWQKLYDEKCLQENVNISELLFIAYKAGKKFDIIKTDDAWEDGDYHTIITDETGYWYGEPKDHDINFLRLLKILI